MASLDSKAIEAERSIQTQTVWADSHSRSRTNSLSSRAERPPVDARRGFPGDEGPELPKALADAGAASAMDTVHHARRDLLGRDDEGREPAGEGQCALLLSVADAALVSVEESGGGHGHEASSFRGAEGEPGTGAPRLIR